MKYKVHYIKRKLSTPSIAWEICVGIRQTTACTSI